MVLVRLRLEFAEAERVDLAVLAGGGWLGFFHGYLQGGPVTEPLFVDVKGFVGQHAHHRAGMSAWPVTLVRASRVNDARQIDRPTLLEYTGSASAS